MRSVALGYDTRYAYSADGNRAAKWTSTKASETLYFNTMWTWHIEKGLSQEQQGQYSKHIYLGETRIVTKQTSDLEENYGQSEEKCHQYYYHPDHLGSAQLVTDYEGNEYQRIEYTPYGELWVEKKTVHEKDMRYLPYKFTAKEMDEETGLYYYDARYLDAKYSRWLSTDPAVSEYMAGASVGEGGIYNTVNFSLYHYAGNDPIRYIDPDGCVDWDMVKKGVENLYKGFGKMGTGVLILGSSGAVGALSVGTVTPVVAVAGIIGGGFVANGFTQFVIGAAEVIGGLSAPEPDKTSPVDDIPNTMNEIIATAIDSVVTAATGENCTKAKEMANFIDDNVDIPANTVVDILIQYQQPLNEPSPMDLQNRYILEDEN